jgi:iron complex outermembrane receptor protein
LNASAQNQIDGFVENSSGGQPLAAASIFIPDLKIGATTDEKGHYQISDLPPGTYLVEASYLGYRSQVKQVTLAKSTTLDFTLNISSSILPELVVTGVPRATEQRKNPIPESMITRRDILQNSSSNIIDAITIIPGVSQITLGPSISKPVIRGLGYNRVVTMNDGVRQEGQQWFDEFGIEIDENSIYKTEVLKGPASLRYGSDAMAGVINFIPSPSLPEGTIKGSLLGEYQTNNGLINAAATLAGNNKGFSWDLLYTTKLAHAYQNKYDGYVWNAGYSENDLKGIFTLNRKWGYSRLTVSMFNMKLGIIEGARDSATGQFQKHFRASDGSDSLDIAPSNEYTEYYNYPIIHQHIRHYKAVLDNSFVIGEGRLNVIVGLQVNHRQEANDITKGDIYNNYFFLRTLNYDVQYILPQKKGWDISFGVNGMQQTSEDRGIVFVLPEYDLFDVGGYGIIKKTFNKLTFSAGLREDIRTLHGKALYVDSLGERLPGPDNSSLEKFSDYHSDFSGFSGSIGIAYDFSKTFYGKLNLSRGFRAPTAAESGQNGIHDGTPFYEIGDHNLKAENSLELDATLGAQSPDITVEATPFVNKINNYIFPEKLESVSGGDSISYDVAAGMEGPTFKYVAGNAVLSGGELLVDFHPQSLTWFDFENSLSTVSAVQLDQGDSSKYLPYTPPTKFTSRVKLFWNSTGGIFQHAFLHLWIDHYFEKNKVFYQFGNETTTPAYTLLNASVGADITSKGRVFATIIIAGNNLTDNAYQSNMSRLKYTDPNNVTGRIGVFNMGRNISFKALIPLDIKK